MQTGMDSGLTKSIFTNTSLSIQIKELEVISQWLVKIGSLRESIINQETTNPSRIMDN